jgi:hypothetical protein
MEWLSEEKNKNHWNFDPVPAVVLEDKKEDDSNDNSSVDSTVTILEEEEILLATSVVVVPPLVTPGSQHCCATRLVDLVLEETPEHKQRKALDDCHVLICWS